MAGCARKALGRRTIQSFSEARTVAALDRIVVCRARPTL